MNNIDTHELKMFAHKWQDVWFSVTDHPQYICGKTGRLISLHGSNRAILSVKLFKEDFTSDYVLILLIYSGNKKNSEYILLEKGWISVFSKAYAAGNVNDGYLKAGSSNKITWYKDGTSDSMVVMGFTDKIHCNFDFPKAGLLTLVTGEYAGTTIVLSRKVGDQHVRGCIPNSNLLHNFVDSDELMEEHGDTIFQIKDIENFAVAIYTAIRKYRPMSIQNAIKQIVNNNYISQTLNRKFAIKLSIASSEFLLMHNKFPIGEVNKYGLVTLFPVYREIKDEVFKELEELEVA